MSGLIHMKPLRCLAEIVNSCFSVSFMKHIAYSQSPKFNKRTRNFCDQVTGDDDVTDLVREVLADIRVGVTLQYYNIQKNLMQRSYRHPTCCRCFEINAAKCLSISERNAIRESIAQVKAFHKRTLPKNWSAKCEGHAGELLSNKAVVFIFLGAMYPSFNSRNDSCTGKISR